MNSKSRRDFLKIMGVTGSARILQHISGGALSSLILSTQKLMASTAMDPEARLVVIRVHGAMDSLLGLHPWLTSNEGIAIEDLFLTYKGQNTPLSAINGTQISLGPAAKNLAEFSQQMAIVRGIYVGPNDLGHPFAIQHMTSGRTQESAPGWASYLGSHLSSQNYVVTNAPLLRGGLKPFPTLLTDVLREQISKVIASSSSSSNLSVYKQKSASLRSYLDLIKQKEKMDKFVEATKLFKGFNQRTYDKALSEDKENEFAAKIKAASEEDIVFASLFSGLSRIAQIDISSTMGGLLDNHDSYERLHLNSQSSRWNKIAGFLKQLQESNLLDKTLVVVVTEFNRTPGKNANGGKDHNYTDNAVALFGRGINGGTVVGDHTLFKREQGFPYAYWAGSFIDFGAHDSMGSGQVVQVSQSGRVPSGADLIRPADVWSSVIHSLAPELVNQLPDEARVIPGLFKK